MDHRAVSFREATDADLPRLVELLANDFLGAEREDPGQTDLAAYHAAFRAISEDPGHQILVADVSGEVVGMLQLSFIPHLTYEGGWRAQIEGVRIASELRSKGLGRRLLQTAIAVARERGCHLVQLTTDRRRPEAFRFYEEMGFEPTHHGFKLHFERGTVQPGTTTPAGATMT